MLGSRSATPSGTTRPDTRSTRSLSGCSTILGAPSDATTASSRQTWQGERRTAATSARVRCVGYAERNAFGLTPLSCSATIAPRGSGEETSTTGTPQRGTAGAHGVCRLGVSETPVRQLYPLLRRPSTVTSLPSRRPHKVCSALVAWVGTSCSSFRSCRRCSRWWLWLHSSQTWTRGGQQTRRG